VNSRLLALITLALVLLAGSWVRLDRLGAREFWTDELNHVFAARALNQGEGPLLPSGEAYRRGIVYTRLVAATEGRTDDPEHDARFPAAILGVVGLVLIAGIAWRLGGPWTAVWATALLAIYPEAIEQSRNVRFYTYQMALGMIGLFAGWYATRPRRVDEPSGSSLDLATRWGGTLIAAASLFLAYQTQPTTLAVIAALGVWYAGVALHSTVQQGAHAVRTSVPVQTIALGALVLLVSFAVGVAGPLLAKWSAQASWRASWVTDGTQSRTYYFYLINSTLGWSMAFLPVAAMVTFRRAPRLTLYLLTWFCVPLLLHTFLLEWKGARYFLLPVPAVILLVSLARAELFGALREHIEETLTPALRGMARGAAMVAVAAAGTWAVVTLPAFSEFRAIVNAKDAKSDWLTARVILDTLPAADSLPWGSTDPLMSLHFWPRIDVGIQPPLADYGIEPSSSHPAPRFAPAIPPHLNDYYTGYPLIFSPDSLRAAYGAYGGIILGVNTDYDSFVHPELREVLKRDAEDLCPAKCTRFKLYLWRFQPAAAAAR